MALDFKNYENALLYGAQIGSVSLQANSVVGAKSSLSRHYVTIVASTTGNVPVNVFGGPAPTSGSITGFYAQVVGASASTPGSATLWGTTAGTITFVEFGSKPLTNGGSLNFLGAMGGGSTAVNASLVAGDTLQISNSTATLGGTATCYITIQTTQ